GPNGPGGNLVLPVEVCFWGDWTVSSVPKPKVAKELFGSRTLSIPPLKSVPLNDAEKALGVGRPTRMSDGTFRFVIQTDRWGKSLDGVVALEIGTPSPSELSWAKATDNKAVVVPATAVGVAANAKDWHEALSKPDLLDIKDGFIVGVHEEAAKAQNLTKSKVPV